MFIPHQDDLGVIAPVQFFLDQALMPPGAGPLVVPQCGCGPQGCTCCRLGGSCFYGTAR